MARKTRWESPYDELAPRCPVCGEECKTIYLNDAGEAVGCDECIEAVNAYEWADKREEELEQYGY